MPFCVKEYTITDENGTVIYQKTDNHQTVNKISFKDKINTRTIKIKLKYPSNLTFASVFGIIVN
jgi:aspartokinase